MRFGPVSLDDAEDASLAHSIGLQDRRLKKGHRLTRADIDSLRSAGLSEVVAVRLDPGDVPEDKAAGRIAAALVPMPAESNVTTAAPFTGRANLYAAAAGVLKLDTGAVAELNRIDEAITLATLADYTRVSARQMIATVKIIPYAVPEDAVSRAEATAARNQVFKVHPVQHRRARLILTRTPGMTEKVLDKGRKAILTRLSALGIHDVDQCIVAHETSALADEIRKSEGVLTLILAGSATSDRRDVGPAALTSAGGRLTRFGMPVDPGNLLFLGSFKGTPVIGLPGCARSPKLNGADWVIERIACGLEVSSDDIARMGAGGLLKEIPSRPEPRHGGATAPRRPGVAAILLAAGQSRRMQGRDKLLEPIDGAPVLERIAREILRSSIDEVICVLPPESQARTDALSGLTVRQIVNPRASEGMGTSIAAAISALSPETDAALIVLADMPDVSADTVDRLIAAFDPDEDRAIIRACAADGTPGHPVLIGRRFFEALSGLEGDAGARDVLRDHPDYIVDIALEDDAAVTDLDTPEAWSEWRARRLL